jgi:hypothetical protein
VFDRSSLARHIPGGSEPDAGWTVAFPQKARRAEWVANAARSDGGARSFGAPRSAPRAWERAPAPGAERPERSGALRVLRAPKVLSVLSALRGAPGAGHTVRPRSAPQGWRRP